MKQHLSKAQFYEQIDEHVEQEYMNSSMNEFLDRIKEDDLKLFHEDCKQLNQKNSKIEGIFAFYCMLKVHKNKTPTPLQPFMSTVKTKLHCLGKFITKFMKDVTTKVSTFTKDTDHLMSFINKLGTIDTDEFLHSADAITTFLHADREKA